MKEIFAHDKLLHYLVGYTIAATLIPLGPVIAMGVTSIAAVGKEVYDKYFDGNPEILDASATILGGFSALGMGQLVAQIA